MTFRFQYCSCNSRLVTLQEISSSTHVSITNLPQRLIYILKILQPSLLFLLSIKRSIESHNAIQWCQLRYPRKIYFCWLKNITKYLAFNLIYLNYLLKYNNPPFTVSIFKQSRDLEVVHIIARLSRFGIYSRMTPLKDMLTYTVLITTFVQVDF